MQPISQQDLELDAATHFFVINNLLKELNDLYVFAETAKAIESSLRKNLENNHYDTIKSSKAFAEKLTHDLQLISKDKHLLVRYSFQPIPLQAEKHVLTSEEKAKNIQHYKRINFGFEKVECLPGNIGYINLRGFFDHEAGAETLAAAMTFLSNTESLIFDLRQNEGGNPAMVALISSYLFGDEAIHLNDLYWRKKNKTEEFWTKPKFVEKKFGDKDVYILTSSRTFSAAEEFCYNLKNLGRAILIGETTSGGAHPGDNVRLSAHFSVFIPMGRAISPITKTNWEGTGVEPDIKVSEEQALKTAHIMALKKSLEIETEESIKDSLNELINKILI